MAESQQRPESPLPASGCSDGTSGTQHRAPRREGPSKVSGLMETSKGQLPELGLTPHIASKPDMCVCVHTLVTQSYLTLCNTMDCSPPGSTLCGIFQARILKWVAISSSRGSSQPRDQTHMSCISCMDRWILYHCATGKPMPYERPKRKPRTIKEHLQGVVGKKTND